MKSDTVELRKIREGFGKSPGLALGDHEVACPKVAITCDYSPGHRAYTPRGKYASIDPPEPAEVSFVEAKLIDGDGLDPTMKQIQDWASDYLDTDDGFSEACNHAEDNTNHGPDPDDAYDRMRDDR